MATRLGHYAEDSSFSAEQKLLDRWAREFGKPLLRFFQKRAPKTLEADDLVQEVFARLARRADLASIENIEGYLFQTASNVLTDHYRKVRTRPDGQELFDEMIHGQADITPERVLYGKQLAKRLVDALYELPDRTRHIFVLYHFENRRQSQIAGDFGMPISTVEKHMARANKHLLQRLGSLSW